MVTDDTFEAMAARAGKREHSLLLAISTPPKVADDGVMRRLVDHGRAGTDPSFYFREFAAPDGCEVDEAAWEVAKPALDDFLHRDALRRPCRRRCARTRFAATGSASGCSWRARGHPMAPGRAAPTLGQHPNGADVVLGFDGSFSGDCTALVAVTVADRPHVHLVKLWEAPEGSRERRMPVVVEDPIWAACACARWRVLEVAADPYRWQRSLELLDAEGIAVSEFPRHPPGWAQGPPGSTPPSSTGC